MRSNSGDRVIAMMWGLQALKEEMSASQILYHIIALATNDAFGNVASQ